METKDKTQIAMLILMSILIVTLIVAVATLSKNADEIRLMPVDYAIEKTSLEQCTCFDESGEAFVFGDKTGDIKLDNMK